ncbi:hypothetical protein AABB24_037420, partial [Solanum stoloniferum]
LKDPKPLKKRKLSFFLFLSLSTAPLSLSGELLSPSPASTSLSSPLLLSLLPLSSSSDQPPNVAPPASTGENNWQPATAAPASSSQRRLLPPRLLQLRSMRGQRTAAGDDTSSLQQRAWTG